MKKIVTTRNHERYKIFKDGSRYLVDIDKGIFLDNWSRIGKTNNLEDALILIRAHSGSEIKEIRDKS